MSTSTETRGGAQDAAVKLLAAGYWPVVIYPAGAVAGQGKKPKEGKEPMGEGWGLERITLDLIRSRFRSFPRAGVGICLGPARAPDGRWLVDLEGDGPEAETSRAKLFGGEIIDTMGWGSTRGGHALHTADADRLAPLVRRLDRFLVADKGGVKAVLKGLPGLPDLELRIGGFKEDGETVKQLQSVVPPTVGTNGKARRWNGCETLAPLPEAAYAALETIAAGMDAPAPAPAPEKAPSRPASRATATASTNGRPDPETRAVAYLARCDSAVSGQNGHNTAFGVACRVGPGFDLPPDVALTLIRQHYNPRCQPPWSERELEHKVADAYRNESRRGWLLEQDRPDYRRSGPNGKPHANGRATAEDARPAIEVGPDWHRIKAEVLKALRRDSTLYRRGDVLVIVGEESEDEVQLTPGTIVRFALGMPKIVPLSQSGLGCELTSIIRLFRWKKDRNGEDIAVAVDPPRWLLDAVATHGVYPGVRPLLGLAECPYPRPDGSLVTRPGYDPETGAILRAGVVPELPEHPDQDDAESAAHRLLDLVRQFPFKSDGDRSVWLAGLLTAIARPAIAGPVPGIALNGNAAGVGKGLLIDVIGIIVNGRPVPTTTYPEEKDEAAKVKTAIALASPPIVHFDNLTEGTFYGNSSLDSAITALTVNERILGLSRNTGDVALRTTWFLSGNNLSPGKDAHRRWLPCNLTSPLERPEERADLEIKDLKVHALARRPQLLRDALVILRAHALAGHPAASPAALGSFEAWDRIVRGAVSFAYGIDPCQTRRDAADESPERMQKLALLEGWRTVPGGSDDGCGVATHEVLKLLESNEPKPDQIDRYELLRNALMAMSKDGTRLPSSRTLGNRIRAMKGANVGGFRFRKAGEKHTAILWVVVKDCPDSHKTGSDRGVYESGESDSGLPRTETESTSTVNAHGCEVENNRDGPDGDSPDS